MMTEKDIGQSLNAKRILIGIGGTVVLGAIGSGLWEMLFRPGLGKIGNLVTSASEMTEATVYTTAALDPTPIPDLLFLLIIVQLPAIMAYLFIERGFIKPAIKRSIARKMQKAAEEAIKSPDPELFVTNYISKKHKFISILGATYSFIFFVLFFYAYMIENKAVVIWRVFNQNIEIISPYISDTELKHIRSKFRSMKNYSDYTEVKRDLNKSATENKIELDWRDGR